jgi:hypothetical protein
VLFEEQFIEQFSDVSIDIFGAAIALKAADDEREAVQQRFQDGG